MTLVPGNGVCKLCGEPINDSCGNETRNCAFCRALKTPYETKRFVASAVANW